MGKGKRKGATKTGSGKKAKGRKASGKKTGVARNPRGAANSIYDKAFKTVLRFIPRLILALVNLAFGTNYGAGDTVRLSSTEKTIPKGGGSATRNADAFFDVMRGSQKLGRYHFEVETWPHYSICRRFLQYDYADATEDGYTEEKWKADSTLPDSCLISLRTPATRPAQLTIRFNARTFSGPIEIPVICVGEYSADEMIQKGLTALMPYFLFRYAKELDKPSLTPELVAEIAAECDKIAEHFEALVIAGELTPREGRDLTEITVQVSKQLARKHPEVSEEVKRSMTGQLLELKTEKQFQALEKQYKKKLARADKKLADQRRAHEAELATADKKLATADKKLATADKKLATADKKLATADKKLADQRRAHAATVIRMARDAGRDDEAVIGDLVKYLEAKREEAQALLRDYDRKRLKA